MADPSADAADPSFGCHTRAHAHQTPRSAVNADEVRNIKFRKGTYDASQVGELLDRIAAELEAGREVGSLIADAAFRQRRLRWRGYDARGVDWYLDQLRRYEDPEEVARANADPWRDLAADPYHIHRVPGVLEGRVAPPPSSQCADEWREFSKQPGIRLMWVRTGVVRHELRTVEQQPLVAARHGRPTTLTTSGRTFTTRASRSAWPVIAEAINRDRPGAPAHMMRRPTDTLRPSLRQILDEAGQPVLFSGGLHIDRTAGAYIMFPSQRWLRFPVRGGRRANAIMTAVDQDRNKIARYRLARDDASSRNCIQLIVHPRQQLTDELAIALALSAPWLSSYFRSSGGG
jgi:DivIVA domain-containing protein